MPQNPEQVIALSAKAYWKKTEEERLRLAQRLWDWYYNDEDKITDYINFGYATTDETILSDKLTVYGGLAKIFPTSYAYMTVKIFNIVTRVIDKLAFVYKENPQRMLNGGKKTEVKGDQIVDVPNPDDDKYQIALTKSTIEKKQSIWNALGKLFNCVLVQPVWIKEKDDKKSYMDFLIHTPAWCTVVTSKSDWLKAEAFYYGIWLQLEEEKAEEQVTVYWSATEHYIIDANGNHRPVPNTNGTQQDTEMINPYGVLTAVPLRFRDGIDFWGEGQWDLINANQEVCEQVTNLAYVAKTQLHGQMVIKDPSNSLKGNIQTGVDHPIHLHGSVEEMAQASVEYINANADLAPVKELVDWWIKSMQSVKGLTPQQYGLDTKILSGDSKEMDATEIEEIRKSDMNTCRMFESDLFDAFRVVYNYHNQSNKISEEAEFSVKFIEPKVLENQTDKNARMKFDIENHLASYIDLIMEKNPGMSREDAQKKFKQIVSEMREIKDDLGLNDIFNKVTEDNANNLPNNPEQSSADSQNPVIEKEL